MTHVYASELPDLQIHRHSLPPFIPLATLTPLLNTNLKQFMNTVSQHVTAFVNRRQQARMSVTCTSTNCDIVQVIQAMKAFPGCILSEPVCTQPVDFVKIVFQPSLDDGLQ